MNSTNHMWSILNRSAKLLPILCSLGLLSPTLSFAQSSVLALSSASVQAGSVVNLTISLTSAYPGQDQGLEWTLSLPPGVTSVTTTAGAAASAAAKRLTCLNQICLLEGMNATPISNGVVGVVSLTLASSASGNLPIQLSNPVEALKNGEGGVISATAGTVSVTPVAAVSVGITPLTASLTASQTKQFSASVTGSTNAAVTW